MKNIIILFSCIYIQAALWVVADHALAAGPNPSTKAGQYKLDSTVVAVNDGNGHLINSHKITFIYNGEGKLTSENRYAWSRESRTWMNVFECSDPVMMDFVRQMEYTYDRNGNLLTETTCSRSDFDPAVVSKERSVLTYGQEGRMNSKEWLYWDQQENSWQKDKKFEYTYDEMGRRTTEISSRYSDQDPGYSNDSKFIYGYDEHDNETSEIFQIWDAASGQWMNKSKSESDYTHEMKLSVEVNYEWNDNTGIWFKTTKTTREYHESGEIALLTEYMWDNINDQWAKRYQTVSDFDEKGNMLSDTRNNWDEKSNEWIPAYKGAYDYNEDDRLCSRMSCYWSEYQEEWRCNSKSGISYHPDGEIASETEYSFYNNRWTPKDSLAYVYHEGITMEGMLEMPEGASLSISPAGKGLIRISKGFSWDAATRSWQVQSLQEYYVSAFVIP